MWFKESYHQLSTDELAEIEKKAPEKFKKDCTINQKTGRVQWHYDDGWHDNLYLLESEKYNTAFESGYDARKKMSGSLNVFAVEDDAQLAVDATNSIIGTRVGVRTGAETAYTFVFSHLQSENGLALYHMHIQRYQ